jgi:hypothetical protein
MFIKMEPESDFLCVLAKQGFQYEQHDALNIQSFTPITLYHYFI